MLFLVTVVVQCRKERHGVLQDNDNDRDRDVNGPGPELEKRGRRNRHDNPTLNDNDRDGDRDVNGPEEFEKRGECGSRKHFIIWLSSRTNR